MSPTIKSTEQVETSVTLHQFADLPEDIGRLIFEYSAQGGHISLALVSKKAQRWVEPVIYRDVLLENPGTIWLFHRTATTFRDSGSSLKSHDFFALHVKTLLFPKYHSSPNPRISAIISACPSITSLSIHGTYEDEALADVIISSTRSPSPTHLYLNNELFKPHQTQAVLTLPIFRNVTHLKLLYFGYLQETALGALRRRCLAEEWPGWKALSSLKNLTHLGLLATHIDADPVLSTKTVMQYAPRGLEVFILVLQLRDRIHFRDQLKQQCWAVMEGEIDLRALVAISMAPPAYDIPEDVSRDWLGHRPREWFNTWSGLLNTGDGIWPRAQQILAQRRKRLQSRRAGSPDGEA